MLSIGVGFIAYMATAVILAYRVEAGLLLTDLNIMRDISFFSPAFYAGVFAATLSSALGSMVAAPRTLYALGEHGVIPASRYFATASASGQPRNAVILTGAVSLILCLSDRWTRLRNY
jgi:amino acid transporter